MIFLAILFVGLMQQVVSPDKEPITPFLSRAGYNLNNIKRGKGRRRRMDIPKRRGLSSFQIIVLGFAGVILLGALLLSLPVSSAAGTFTPFIDALFTATTSVCVTGLVVYDTATYWSGFGHTVILLLIQIGGMGVITVAAAFAMFSGRRIGLFQRSTMQEAVAAPKMSGIVRLTGFIILSLIHI